MTVKIDEPEKVTGGAGTRINTLIDRVTASSLPEAVKRELLKSLKQSGIKAAEELADKLSEAYPSLKPILTEIFE